MKDRPIMIAPIERGSMLDLATQELDRLRAQLAAETEMAERLRTALQMIAEQAGAMYGDGAKTIECAARAALKGETT